MDASPLARLRAAMTVILAPDAVVHTLRPEALEMAGVLAGACSVTIDRASDPSVGESWTPGGLAISPTLAAMCAEDYVRTIRFVRGLHGAIQAAQEHAPDRPVRVLYAGCGPYATLAVPLMAVLPPSAARFTLLDLHPESVDSARAVIGALGLEAFVEAIEVGDAGAYRIDPQAPPDVIVLEIMQRSLEKEPQVSVTRHLLAQAPDALLVPDLVQVDLVLMDFRPGDATRGRVHVGTAFALDATAVAAWGGGPRDHLPGATLRLPSRITPGQQPMLSTSIRTFGDEVIRPFESGLTGPRPLVTEGALAWGDEVRFSYRLGPHPDLYAEVVPPPASFARTLRRWGRALRRA